MKKITLFAVVLLVCTTVFSQTGKVNNNWYFSSSTTPLGVTFNNPNGSPSVLTDSQAENEKAASSVSDSSGNLLFYFDGIKVRNKHHQVMPNGVLEHLPNTTNEIAEEAIIVPDITNNDRYYIFIAHNSYLNLTESGYYYSIVDMSLDSGNGDVVQNVGGPLLDANGLLSLTTNNGHKRLASYYNKVQNIIWITILDGFNRKILTYKMDSNGFSDIPVQVSSDVTFDQLSLTEGGMRISPDGSKIAMSLRLDPQNTSVKDAIIADFNTSTGAITNPKPITVTEVNDVEFSPDSQTLYLRGSSGLYSVPVSATTGPATNPAIPSLFLTRIQGRGSIQLGPDDKLYFNHIIGTAAKLGVIENPNNTITNLNIIGELLTLSATGGTNLTTLPQRVIDLGVRNELFITTWVVDSNDKSITIPTFSGETYNYTVEWGDGTISTNQTGDATHTFNDAGTYTVSISGTFPRIYFNHVIEKNSSSSITLNKDKIIAVNQWGTNQWTSMDNAFWGCSNLEVLDTKSPNLAFTTNLFGMFAYCSSMNQPLNNWDVSNITDMRFMFYYATSFNQPLDQWDVSNVTRMGFMFARATNFNQSLGNWDISNVSKMSGMLDSSGLSKVNYDATLIGWNNLPSLQIGVSVGAYELQYCSSIAVAARQNIQNTYGWYFSGDSNSCRSGVLEDTKAPQNISESLTVYPNPGTETIFVNYKKGTLKNYVFQIVDLSGRVILQNNENNKLDVSHLKKGIYILKVLGLKKQGSIRFIKE
ncbi:BspA family leucine-rich repeat surface protein [Pseudotenacibaculum haliotis]|uniref:BspA family leucine-rich repeat surface protein n=1 Tax=Pseudotenacibaculum haliotis TaxID=1862138 RepID=A0ABW5LTY6_9FLAO